MKSTLLRCVGVCAVAASCGTVDDGSNQIDITQANDLGVTTIQTTRVVDHGNDVFTVRGLSATGEQLASLRLTVGTISDLPDFLPGKNDVGSEIVVSVAGSDDLRTLSRETQRLLVQPMANSAPFLELPAVVSVLERDADLIIVSDGLPVASDAETNYTCGRSCQPPPQVVYSEGPAPAADLDAPPKPAAMQACLMSRTTTSVNDLREIYQALANQGPSHNQAAFGYRFQNPHGPGTGCRGPDGIASCNLTTTSPCTYGPNGWSLPTVSLAPVGQYAFIQMIDMNRSATTGESCGGVFVTSPPTPVFPTVTGTFPSNCSCCADGSGVCCGTACSTGTCAQVAGGPRADAVAGQWDL